MTSTIIPQAWYEVEVVGKSARYAGPDFDAAVSALLTVDTSIDEGYAVATVGGAYSPAESARVESAARSVPPTGCVDPGNPHAHCLEHGCVEYVCCVPIHAAARGRS